MASKLIDPQDFSEAAEMLKALAHPLRLQIASILCEREQHVNGLAELLNVQQAIVSQQLRILRMRGLVAATRNGGFAQYRVIEPHLKDMITCIEKCLVDKGAHRR